MTHKLTLFDDADVEDLFADAISDTMDMDWQPSWAASHIVHQCKTDSAFRGDLLAWLLNVELTTPKLAERLGVDMKEKVDA